MIKQGLALIALLAIAGCASEGTGPGPTESQSTPAQMSESYGGLNRAELAAYAGAHAYPTTMPVKSDLKVAAIVNADQRTIKIYNFGSEPIVDADIWVNQSYVRHVNAIAPGSSVTLPQASLYNSLGQQFAASGDHLNQVQIQLHHSVQNVWGPAAQ